MKPSIVSIIFNSHPGLQFQRRDLFILFTRNQQSFGIFRLELEFEAEYVRWKQVVESKDWTIFSLTGLKLVGEHIKDQPLRRGLLDPYWSWSMYWWPDYIKDTICPWWRVSMGRCWHLILYYCVYVVSPVNSLHSRFWQCSTWLIPEILLSHTCHVLSTFVLCF